VWLSRLQRRGQHNSLTDVLRKLNKCLIGILFVFAPAGDSIDTDLPLED
jgi:hypothetical protein